jgi:hypothetical protein
VDPDPLGLTLDVDKIIESYADKEKLLFLESQVKDMQLAIENIIKLKAETKLEITQLTGMFLSLFCLSY